MATNPDNVGEMFYPSGDDVDQMIEAAIQCGIDNRGTSWPVKLCRLRAKVRAELCRAAPAGGDARTVPFSDWMEAQHELGELRTMLARSAPVGSGEVSCGGYPESRPNMPDCKIAEGLDRILSDAISGHVGGIDRDGEDALRRAAALLRKLQQGADYVMVPREATKAMQEAFFDANAKAITIFAGVPELWRAMVSASQGQEGE